jgi:4-amino-4-deoxy-L-arabinose transferase and related glycosyltransferases of PMT family
VPDRSIWWGVFRNYNKELQRPLRLILLIALAAMLLAAFVAFHRPAWSDEGWFADPAYNLARHGSFGSTHIDPAVYNLKRIDQRTYWVMPGFLLGEAAWLIAAPATLFSMRLFSILWIAPTALACYVLVSKVTRSPRVGLLAALLLAFDYQFLSTAAYVRPDVMCLAFGLGALACYVGLREKNLHAAAALSCFLLAISGIIHPNAILHAFGLGVLALAYDRRRLSWSIVAAGLAGFAIVVSLYAVYAMQDPEAWRAQLLANSYGRAPRSWNPMTILWLEIKDRYAAAYSILSPDLIPRLKGAVLLVFASSLFAAALSPAIRDKDGTKLLLALWLAYFSVQCVFNQKLSYYLVHILPMYAALVAQVAVQLPNRLTGWIGGMRRFVYPVLAGFVLLNAGGVAA